MTSRKSRAACSCRHGDLGKVTEADLKVVTEKAPTPEQIQDMLFAWTVVKYVKSNAIIFCKDNMTIGVGAGQMSRVYSTKIAAIKAADEGLEVKGSVMASDAFFPFRDGIDAAAETGIAAIIQPGGSMRDDEVIAGRERARPGHGVHRHATLQSLMKILIIGSGGREHALSMEVCAVRPVSMRSSLHPATPARRPRRGAATSLVSSDDIEALAQLAQERGGRPDHRRTRSAAGCWYRRPFISNHWASPCFGPSAAAAQLEGSKAFTKDFLARHNIPTAAYREFHRP